MQRVFIKDIRMRIYTNFKVGDRNSETLELLRIDPELLDIDDLVKLVNYHNNDYLQKQFKSVLLIFISSPSFDSGDTH